MERSLRVRRDLQAAALEEVDRAVDGDPLQPRAERTALVEAVERCERLLDRLLRRVVGEGSVGDARTRCARAYGQ